MLVTGRIAQLVILLVILGVSYFYIDSARRGKKLREIRKLPPVEAIEEAIGRATEMAKPIVYSYGWGEILQADKSPMTLAGINILSYVAKRTAAHGTTLLVSAFQSATVPLVEATVYEAYLAQGVPEAYKRENIVYQAETQYPWAAGTLGMIRREEPAAVILMGFFWGEALMLVMAGVLTKSIKIAGSAFQDAIPWFAAACDYTLIGEELYAASAYSSKEPLQIATITAQDLLKVLLTAILIIGGVLMYAGNKLVLTLLRS